MLADGKISKLLAKVEDLMVSLEKPQGSCPRKDDRYASVVPRVGRIIAGKKESSGGQKILSEIWTRWA